MNSVLIGSEDPKSLADYYTKLFGEPGWNEGGFTGWRLCRLPLVAPGLAATAVFCLIVSWNEFLFALVLTQTDAGMTLPVGIARGVTQYEIKWGVMSAAGTVATLPFLCLLSRCSGN